VARGPVLLRLIIDLREAAAWQPYAAKYRKEVRFVA
jgi:hypothetical protein